MIYFLQATDGGSVKIGHAVNVAVRHRQLESYYGRPLALLATMDGDRDTEREVHARFAHLRFGRTEQFRPAAELMAFIGRPLLVDPNPDAVAAMAGSAEQEVELPADDMERVRRAARSIGLSLSAFIRQAVLEKTVETERKMRP